MKSKITLLFLFFICMFNVKSQETTSAIGVSVGLPITNYFNNAGDFSTSIFLENKLVKKVGVCVGISYDNIDLPLSDNQLTYDKEYIGGYVGIFYRFNILKELNLNPELDIGYALVNYKTNELKTEKQKASGFIARLGCKITHQFSNNFNIYLGLFNNSLIKKLPLNNNLIIPANYISTSKSVHNNLLIELGIKINI